jgi:hypothetical protein
MLIPYMFRLYVLPFASRLTNVMPLRLRLVALTADRRDVARYLRILLQLLPQPGNMDVHRARPMKGWSCQTRASNLWLP